MYIIRPRNTEYLYSQRWSCYEIAPAMTPFNILIDDNIIMWIPAPDACLHEHNNTSYAVVAGKKFTNDLWLLMDVNFRMLTGITVIWMLQAESWASSVSSFLKKLGHLKKKRKS